MRIIFLLLLVISAFRVSAQIEHGKLADRILKDKVVLKQRLLKTSYFKDIKLSDYFRKDNSKDKSLFTKEEAKRMKLDFAWYYKFISVQYEAQNYIACNILHIFDGNNKQKLVILDYNGVAIDEVLIHARIAEGLSKLSENRILGVTFVWTVFEKDCFYVFEKLSLQDRYREGYKEWEETYKTKYVITNTGNIQKIEKVRVQ